MTQNYETIALSPNMLLHGRNFNIFNLPTESNEQDPDFVLVDREVIANSFKKLNHTLLAFDKLWSSNYIDALKEQHVRNPKHGSNKIIPKVGDVVILIDDKGKLNTFSRIFEVKISKDGEVRAAQILTKTGLSWWPISMISHFEVADANNLPVSFANSYGAEDNEQVVQRVRSSRVASSKAKALIK